MIYQALVFRFPCPSSPSLRSPLPFPWYLRIGLGAGRNGTIRSLWDTIMYFFSSLKSLYISVVITGWGLTICHLNFLFGQFIGRFFSWQMRDWDGSYSPEVTVERVDWGCSPILVAGRFPGLETLVERCPWRTLWVSRRCKAVQLG
jgi:hypothetical protein